MTKELTIERSDLFKKEFKKLIKKYKNLEKDLGTFVNAQLSMFHIHEMDNGGIVQIPLTKIHNPLFFKARKFRSRDFPKSGVQSGFRIIYAFHPKEIRVELIEIYHKSNKPNHDEKRIKSHGT
ncbi:MAG: hypothetical protein ABFQ95_01220 [Pseudomonadota bacterium]